MGIGAEVHKGDEFISHPDERLSSRHQITVKRVARDNSWADIAVRTWAVMWTKRQPLPFAFPYETGFLDFLAQEEDHMAMLRERGVVI